MEISVSVSRAKSEAESQARKAYRELLTKQRPNNDASEEDVAATIDAMKTLGITTEQAEEDARLHVDVVTATADRDAALAEAERLGPEGDVSYRQQLDDIDVALAEVIDRLLEPKRVLLAKMAIYESAAEVLKSQESRLGYARTQVPRLCG